jgi:hypothetical protein
MTEYGCAIHERLNNIYAEIATLWQEDGNPTKVQRREELINEAARLESYAAD